MTERERKEQEITILKSQLSSDASRIGDWAIIKCYEARLTGKEDPYDINDLLSKRQEIRDRINQIQEEIKNMPDTVE